MSREIEKKRDYTKWTKSQLIERIKELEMGGRDSENDMLEQRGVLRNILDNVDQGVVLFDSEKRLVAYNAQYPGVLGLSEEILKPGLHIWDLAYELAKKGYYGEGDPVELTNHRAKIAWEASALSKERSFGSERVFDVKSTRTPSGGLVITYTDITERKRSEVALRESESRLLAFLNNAAAPITLKDLEGRFLLVNKVFAENQGMDPESVVGKTAREFLPRATADILEDQERRVLKTEEPFVNEVDIVSSDGVMHRYQVTKFPVFDTESDVIAIGAVSSDITERKQAEDELQVAKADAEAANRAKSEFLSSMSHELRTPLNAIIGFSELVIEDEDEPLNEEQRECIGNVIKAGQHLLELINEVLDLSKIEIGAVSLSMEPVDVSEVVGECVELNAALASRNGIALENKVAGTRLPPIHVDRTRFKQILLNFLSNAVKYNRENGSITIEQAYLSEQTVRVSVTDTGPGISEDHLETIFNPFDRLGAETTDIEGTGIGLTITKRLVEQMAGEIGVESALGNGSTFWISFPIAQEVIETVEKG